MKVELKAVTPVEPGILSCIMLLGEKAYSVRVHENGTRFELPLDLSELEHELNVDREHITEAIWDTLEAFLG